VLSRINPKGMYQTLKRESDVVSRMEQKTPQIKMKKVTVDVHGIYCERRYSETKRTDGWISCRKCAKWDHENCIGWPENDLDHLSAVLVKKISTKLILEQNFMYPTVPQNAPGYV